MLFDFTGRRNGGIISVVIYENRAERRDILYRIMIVEDDRQISSAIKRGLSAWGCDVCETEDFTAVTGIFRDYSPHLVLLDISLPFCDGYYWCREIRKISSVPVIFISSASDSMNIVMAMNMGGDEFIEKPFDFAVVTAKVQAVLRRTYEFRGNTNMLEWHGAYLNLSDATLQYQEQKMELTKNEFRILQMLIENAGKIISRDNIITRLWESDEFIDDNTLTVNVARLRRKLEKMGLENVILTKKGIGYMVEA